MKMKSPRCKSCKHAMSEHGPEGCRWCAELRREPCVVVGTFEKVWEADTEQQIRAVLAQPPGEGRDRLLRSLRSGHDKYSVMRSEALLRIAGQEDAGLNDAELRWVCRGLPAQLAMWKVELDKEERYAYAQVAEKGAWIE